MDREVGWVMRSVDRTHDSTKMLLKNASRKSNCYYRCSDALGGDGGGGGVHVGMVFLVIL